MAPPQGDLVSCRFIYMFIANSLETWSILGTRIFKFVQMKSLGSQIAPPQKGAKKGNIFFKSSDDEPVDQMQN